MFAGKLPHKREHREFNVTHESKRAAFTATTEITVDQSKRRFLSAGRLRSIGEHQFIFHPGRRERRKTVRFIGEEICSPHINTQKGTKIGPFLLKMMWRNRNSRNESNLSQSNMNMVNLICEKIKISLISGKMFTSVCCVS